MQEVQWPVVSESGAEAANWHGVLMILLFLILLIVLLKTY